MREVELANGDIVIYKKNNKSVCMIENYVFFANIKKLKELYKFFKKSIISEFNLENNEKCKKVDFSIMKPTPDLYGVSIKPFNITDYEDLLHKINYIIKTL